MDQTARYDALVDRAEALYEEERYGEAVELLATESGGLEPWIAELAHLKACLLGAGGDADAALRTLQEASAGGAWWVSGILVDDDDLAGLRGRPEFEALVAASRERVADDPVPPLIDVPMIAAGFSAGGRAALNWALTAQPTPVAGVLVLAPALRELTVAGKLSPATIWIGDDDDLRDVVEGAAEKLESFGCTIERIPGLGHTFPADFDDRLRGLAGQV